jgi:hypothetical protein
MIMARTWAPTVNGPCPVTVADTSPAWQAVVPPPPEPPWAGVRARDDAVGAAERSVCGASGAEQAAKASGTEARRIATAGVRKEGLQSVKWTDDQGSRVSW